MRIGVLGQTEVSLDRGPLPLTSRKPRQIVATLALAGRRPVSFDALVDMLWGNEPPEGLPGTLHAYIAALRKQLEPDRAPRAPARTLVTVGNGYALRTGEDDLDAVRFHRSIIDVNRRLDRPDPLTPPGLRPADLADAAAQLGAALALWRGEPYADLPDADVVLAERGRLAELRVVALEDLATLRLAQGSHGLVAAELESLTATHPLRERLWILRAQALYAAGRQADALDVLRRFGDLLDEELGIEASPLLRDLQVRILRQDPTLSWNDSSRPADRTHGAPPTSVLSARPARPLLPDWPMVGRSGQLDALLGALGRAAGGVPTYAIVTGEPGIGKSRLCAELAAQACDEGARLLWGRCSQDDGAPPLWPWRQVLLGLGHDLEVAAGDEGAAFRTWEAIAHRIRDAARHETLVVVLDDLQWADTPTLKALRLLVETVTDGRLLVLATWRSHPDPGGALADAADALARAHATRVALTGLDEESAADVVAAIARRPDPRQAAELARRTDGNPFYLVEFARLARHDGLDPTTVPAMPQAVSDVVARRIHQLPETAVASLRAAGVVGRSFELSALRAAVGPDVVAEDDLLDHLDRAVAAGLVREDGIGRWTFGHALVRDAAYAGLGATRAARAHARVAAGLDALPGRETEAARHWRAAGPGHARQAWQAFARAAAVASRLHGHDEASALLREALDALDRDTEGGPRDRYDLLIRLCDSERWSGQWTALKDATESALDVAEGLDDLELVARAASVMATGAFWQTTQYGEVHERHVEALRRCLDELPPSDSALRCRVMNALSTELYYRASPTERQALTAQAVAMARRLGDRELLVDALLSGYVSSWRPATAAAREQQAREAIEISLRIHDGARYVVAGTLLSVVLGELGRVEEMWEIEAGARSEAERLRLPYGLVVLDGLVVGWHAMAGRREESLAAVERMTLASQRIVLFQMDEALLGAAIVSETWQGDLTALVPGLAATQDLSPIPLSAPLAQMMVRSGQVERAREHVAAHPIVLPEQGDWYSMLMVASAAEVAAWLVDPELAGRCYAWLAPYAGHAVQAGSGVAQGPVDAYLAMAAATTGQRELAVRHADDADELMGRWDIPRCADWFTGVRRRLGL